MPHSGVWRLVQPNSTVTTCSLLVHRKVGRLALLPDSCHLESEKLLQRVQNLKWLSEKIKVPRRWMSLSSGQELEGLQLPLRFVELVIESR